jgi:carboxypeptidase PM20D1
MIYVLISRETGGHSGAKMGAQWFKKKQIEFEFVLDEGLMIVNEIVPGYPKEFALVGMAEKGMANYIVK